MKRALLFIGLLLLVLPMKAQDFQDYKNKQKQELERYKDSVKQGYDDYRRRANEEYAQFMRERWEEFKATRNPNCLNRHGHSDMTGTALYPNCPNQFPTNLSPRQNLTQFNPSSGLMCHSLRLSRM